jgi:ABC-2 type transport system permease protein
MNNLLLAFRQVRYENRAFWRNPQAAFFIFVFPLIFLFVFNTMFGNSDIDTPAGRISGSTFYVPAIVALSVVFACYINIAISVSLAREQGILKRVRGTPLPAAVYMAGRIAHATLIAVLLVVIVVAAGRVIYNVEMPTSTLPAFLVTLVVGAACFCSMGLAVTTVIGNADAANAVVNASMLPLLFISDVYIPSSNTPNWLTAIANVFPVKHFAEALHTSFSPFETSAGFEYGHLFVMALWGVAAAFVATRFFSWEPRR